MEQGGYRLKYPDLPVSGAREEILDALRENQVVVVVGATGSGKTTQLPKMALEYLSELNLDKPIKVGCTQPRRLAAASVAKRVAEEMLVVLGEEVGYQVRFENRTKKDTSLKFMTDGILLAETQGDVSLAEYGVIIIDEAHERSLNIDFLLGYLKRLLSKRKDLRVIISSATLDAGGFSDFFEGAPMINVEGRTFPVETKYLPDNGEEDMSRHVARAVSEIARGGDLGDILVFLPGEREIRECADVLEGRGMAQTEILPLFARMGMAEQQKVFSTSERIRRVVLATNVAETSLTIPGIVYVVDTGVARVSRWNPSRQVQRLQVEKISQASARQRQGRCGRICEGVCVRLYSEDDFEEREDFTDPEIRRSSLAGVILRMKALHLPEITEFPFLDPPSDKHIAEGYRTLREIGALDGEDELSHIGKKIAHVPIEPRLARMLLESVRVGCYEEMLVIVSGLSIMDPRERPAEKKNEADAQHKRWDDEESDFVSLLHLWSELSEYKETGKRGGWQRNKLRKFCKRSFLNFRRVMEWGNLLSELRHIRLTHGKGVKPTSELGQINSWASNEVIHKALLVGMPRQVGKYDKEDRAYKGVSAKEFAIFPGSGMFGKKKPEWILAYDMVDTTRLWARKVALIDPKWLEEVVPDLCRYRYHGAKWDRKQGAVYAKEVVMFGPLRIVDGRNVHFGRVDPKASWTIFVREGLLGNGLNNKPKCLRRVDSFRGKVLEIEQKLRRVGGIWSEEKIVEFFETRIPKEIYTAKAFYKWETKHGDDILLELQDVMYDDVESIKEELQGYPDSVQDGEQEYSVYYKTEYGAVDDGITLGVHVDQLPAMSEDVIEWGLSGSLEERTFLLIKGLPKGQRVLCNPAAERAKLFTNFITEARGFGKGSYLDVLSYYLSRETGASIDKRMFHLSKLPEEMQTKVWVCDDDGGELAMGKDLESLRKKLASVIDQRFEDESGAEWEMSGLHDWECGMLPESIEVRGKFAFPGLVDEGASVGVSVFLTQWESERNHLSGCVRLFLKRHADHSKYVSKNLPLSTELKLYLPHLGEKGINQAELLRIGIAGVFSRNLPRNAEDFYKTADAGRGELFENVETIGRLLEQVISINREVDNFIEKNASDKHLGEVADDLRIQKRWLLRAGFLSEVGWAGLQRYPVYFQAMLERIKRLKSFPIIKDLEKMDAVLDYLDPWAVQWQSRKGDGDLMNCAYLIEELRVNYFAPNLMTKGAVSEKKVEQELANCGILLQKK